MHVSTKTASMLHSAAAVAAAVAPPPPAAATPNGAANAPHPNTHNNNNRAVISQYAHQPSNASGGLVQAYGALARGIATAAAAVSGIPTSVYNVVQRRIIR